MEWVKDPEQVWKYRNTIVVKMRLVDLIKEYKLNPVTHDSGVTYKLRCPFHKGGRERTPSFVLYSQSNTFYCFGCGKSGTVIDFVSIMDGVPVSIAMEKLAKKIGIIDKDGQWDELLLDSLGTFDTFDPQKTIDPFLFKISFALRDYIQQFIDTEDFEKELRWAERVGAKVDEFVSQMNHEDWEDAEELYSKVKLSLNRRKNRV